ncbi:MAG: hypothetical protein QME81_20065, partial [bacterium]|nr:hypothetical protein [bacterium]
MKYIFRKDMAERLPEILGLLQELAKKHTGLEYLEIIVTYLTNATDKLTEEELGKAVEVVLPSKGGEFMATLAEKWVEQGMREGEREGERKGEKKGLLEAIEMGLNFKFGQEGLDILPEIRRVQNIDVLMAVQKGLWTMDSLKELCKVYRH